MTSYRCSFLFFFRFSFNQIRNSLFLFFLTISGDRQAARDKGGGRSNGTRDNKKKVSTKRNRENFERKIVFFFSKLGHDQPRPSRDHLARHGPPHGQLLAVQGQPAVPGGVERAQQQGADSVDDDDAFV